MKLTDESWISYQKGKGQRALTRITHQVSRAFDLNLEKQGKDKPERGADLGEGTV